jgi:phospholipid/cholesterol/gamma-HCH transport system permease protein
MHTGFKNHINENTINISNFDSQYPNKMFKFLTQVGQYFLFLKKVFSKPEKPVIYYKQTMRELVSLGLTSVGIVAIISFFMGAVITLQTAYNTENPIYPKYLIGLGCRDSMILEFSSTIAALLR